MVTVPMVQGNPERDFFEQNPELKNVAVFRDLFEDYTGHEASTIMWALYLSEDPNSKLYNIPIKERREEVEATLPDMTDEMWETVKDLSNRYSRLILPKEASLFKMWCDKLDELVAHIKDLSIEEDEQKLLRLMKAFESLIETEEKFKKKFEAAKAGMDTRKGFEESARESRLNS